MKKASGWIIMAIGALCLVFFAGLFVGRSSIDAPGSNDQTRSSTPTVYVSPAAANTKININSADSALLQQLPGIGEVLAGRIIAYRDEHGPFGSVRDLEKVEGIGSGKMVEILELICVEDEP